MGKQEALWGGVENWKTGVQLGDLLRGETHWREKQKESNCSCVDKSELGTNWEEAEISRSWKQAGVFIVSRSGKRD